MHGSRIPLNKWFLTIYMMTRVCGYIRVHRLKDMLKVSYQTAWRMRKKVYDEHARNPMSPIMGLFR